MKKLFLLLVPFIFSCTSKIEPVIIQENSVIQQKNDIEAQLIKELTYSLDKALLASKNSSTTTEAEKIAEKIFIQELSKAFNKPIKSINYQFQAQAQLTVNKTIQIQLQAQISDKNITAQAQRQIDFKPM